METDAASMTPYRFDDRDIQWREFGDFKHLVVSIFFVDIDFLCILGFL